MSKRGSLFGVEKAGYESNVIGDKGIYAPYGVPHRTVADVEVGFKTCKRLLSGQ